MALLINRLKYFCYSNKIALFDKEKRRVIGKLVAAAYHEQKDPEPLKIVINKEKDGIFRVLKYPTSFIPQMDAIISNYHQGKYKTPDQPEKRKRQRIPLKYKKVNYNG